MKGSFLLIDKIATIIVLLFIVIDIMPLMDIPLMAFFIPLIIIGLLRGASVALLLLINMFIYVNGKIKANSVKNKN